MNDEQAVSKDYQTIGEAHREFIKEFARLFAETLIQDLEIESSREDSQPKERE